jgi:hypothetical protein
MIFEIAHQMDLVPLVAVALVSRRRLVSPVAWLLACAWLVSWFGSSLQHFAGGLWWPSYVWLPVQLGLVLAAFKPERLPLIAGALAALAVVSALLTAPGPDVLLTLVGSVGVLVLARGRYVLPVFLYFGVGSVFYLLMIQRVGDGFTPMWLAYQGSRAAAYVAFLAFLLLRPRRASWANG